MDRIIAANSVVFADRDTPPASGTPQYATDGDPSVPTPATVWPAYQYNSLQEEIMTVLATGSVTPNKAVTNQLATAIIAIIAAAIAGLAPLNSPLFTGDPRAPTPGNSDNDTSIATTAWVRNAITTILAAFTFTSAAIPVGTGISGVIAHGLGAIPKSIDWYLLCTASSSGWVTGQHVFVGQGARNSDTGVTVGADAANLDYQVGNDGITITTSSGATVEVTGGGNFSLVLVARAF